MTKTRAPKFIENASYILKGKSREKFADMLKRTSIRDSLVEKIVNDLSGGFTVTFVEGEYVTSIELVTGEAIAHNTYHPAWDYILCSSHDRKFFSLVPQKQFDRMVAEKWGQYATDKKDKPEKVDILRELITLLASSSDGLAVACYEDGRVVKSVEDLTVYLTEKLDTMRAAMEEQRDDALRVIEEANARMVSAEETIRKIDSLKLLTK